MEPRKSKVKIPCNHTLEYVEKKALSDGLDWAWLLFGRPDECNGCGESFTAGYFCPTCKFGAHTRCIDFPDMINHPCHSLHPLKMVPTNAIGYTDGKCHFCRNPLDDDVMYHCSMCNFSLDLECWRNPPPLTIYNERSHKHAFNLMPIIHSPLRL